MSENHAALKGYTYSQLWVTLANYIKNSKWSTLLLCSI